MIYRSEDITILIFRIFGLKCLLRPQNGGFGDFGPLNVSVHHRDPQKALSCVNPHLLSYHSTVKIRWGVWPVGKLTESVMDTYTQTHTDKFIFCPCIALDRQWISSRTGQIVLLCDRGIRYMNDLPRVTWQCHGQESTDAPTAFLLTYFYLLYEATGIT